MNQQGIFKKWLWAGVMGILTILLCLIVSDDLLGLNSPPARSQIGHYVFWVSLIGLPLLFYKFVSWRYTLLNIPLYFLLYFPAQSAWSDTLLDQAMCVYLSSAEAYLLQF